jgi:hypothetical protein
VAERLSTAAVSALFKKMAAAAGATVDEAGRISGHSSRVGATQDMARHGLSCRRSCRRVGGFLMSSVDGFTLSPDRSWPCYGIGRKYVGVSHLELAAYNDLHLRSTRACRV